MGSRLLQGTGGGNDPKKIKEFGCGWGNPAPLETPSCVPVEEAGLDPEFHDWDVPMIRQQKTRVFQGNRGSRRLAWNKNNDNKAKHISTTVCELVYI